MEAGYLSLHMGCMRADKSVFATRKATRYADLGESVLYATSTLGSKRDVEGGDDVNFTSHSSSNRFLSPKVHTMTRTSLGDIDVSGYNMIVIDEAHFFEDIVETVLHWVDELKKRVYVVGLDSSFKRTVIGRLLELIPHADRYEKFTAKCERCLRERKYVDAIFSLLENSTETTDIINPGNAGYVPVCRYHYNLAQ